MGCEAPYTKHQITNKIDCPPAGRNDQNSNFKTKAFESFGIGDWDLIFGMC